MVPKHIGIILDGNRRFAKRLMAKPWKGHEWGRDKVRNLLDWIRDFPEINELTLYSFSVENFNRPKEEFDYLMKICLETFEDLCVEKNIADLKQKGIRINFIGRLWMFPENIQLAQKKLMDLTKDNAGITVNFAMAYGGRQEVIDAVKLIAGDIKSGKLSIDQINEQSFNKYMWLESEPDLIIRTGGDRRTSNFLIWQSSYSEWFFLEKCWPEFEKTDLKQVIDEFGSRERRFGR